MLLGRRQIWNRKGKIKLNFILHFLIARSDVVFFVTLNLIRFLSCLYEPFMPSLSAKINFLLNLEKRSERDDTLLEYINKGKDHKILLTFIPQNLIIRKPVVLFTESKIKNILKKIRLK